MQTDLECVGKLLVYDLDHAGKLALLPLREMFEARSHIQPIGLRRFAELIGTILSNVKLLVARWI